jgi:hypothetical protein
MRVHQALAAIPILLHAAAVHGGGTCSRNQEVEALDTAAYLSTWPSIHDSFQRFRECDDGAIAEGYSESVTRVLDTQWATIGTLAELGAKTPGFLAFVLRHIDETAPPDRLARIAARARSECPAEHENLCSQIADATRP